jgi:hypothetical protein
VLDQATQVMADVLSGARTPTGTPQKTARSG